MGTRKKLKVDLNAGETLGKGEETLKVDRTKLDKDERVRCYLVGFRDGSSNRPGRLWTPDLLQFPYQEDYDEGYAFGQKSRFDAEVLIRKQVFGE